MKIEVPETISKDRLVLNNHLKKCDHTIVMIEDKITLVLVNNSGGKRPLYLPSGSTAITVEWTAHFQLPSIHQFESLEYLVKYLKSDYDEVMANTGNYLSLIHKIDNSYIPMLATRLEPSDARYQLFGPYDTLDVVYL